MIEINTEFFMQSIMQVAFWIGITYMAVVLIIFICWFFKIYLKRDKELKACSIVTIYEDYKTETIEEGKAVLVKKLDETDNAEYWMVDFTPHGGWDYECGWIAERWIIK